MPVSFERMTAPQLLALPKTQTVFFFPVGPLEDHGSHLPMGVDGLEAKHLCWDLAEKLELDMPAWKAVIMPHAPLGVDSDTRRLALTVRAHVLRDWLVDACLGLWRSDFRHFVCVSGHLGPKQLTAIEEAGKLVRRKGGGPLRWLKSRAHQPILVSASSALVDAAQVSRSPLWPDPDEHGGWRDTSVALELEQREGEAWVERGFMTAPPKPRPASRWLRWTNRLNRKTEGAWGTRSPSDSQPEAGKRELRDAVDTLYPKLKAVWTGSNPEALFRSWYSVIPSNGSFFRAWGLVLTTLILMAVWVYLSLANLTT